MYGSIDNEAMSLRYISAESKIVRVFLQSRLCVNCLVNGCDLAICGRVRRGYYKRDTTMSQSSSTSTSSSHFRTVFVAAIKEYETKTKTDLHTHPLATQLQSCNSSNDILAVLHDKVNEFDTSRSHNERLLSWLNPTINVLYAFSSTVGQGVGLVSLN